MTDGRPDAGVVLTGGASRRMGADKALLAPDGTPFALGVANVLRSAGCEPVWCQGGDATALSALGLIVHPDDHPGEGPVGAIVSALRRSVGAGVVVAACDLPDLTPASVERVRSAATEGEAVEVAVAMAAGRRHLLSWWSSSTLPELERCFASGERGYLAVLSQFRAVEVDVDEGDLRNVNRPGDVA